MRRQYIALAALLALASCKSEAERQKEVAEAKQKQDEEIDKRARAIAQEMAKKIEADEEKKRGEQVEQIKADEEKKRTEEVQQAAAQRRAAVDAARLNLVQNPARFFQASDARFLDKGIINSYRHLTTITLANRSPFSVSGIQGKVDFYDATNNLMATIPVTLRGALGPGSSMIFSEQQGNLTGGTVQLSGKVGRATFAVTKVLVAPLAIDPSATQKQADEAFRKAMEAAAAKKAEGEQIN